MLLGGNIIKLRMYGGLLGELFYYTSPDHQTDYQSMLECFFRHKLQPQYPLDTSG